MNSPILPILTLKLDTVAMSLEPLLKGGQFGNLRSNDSVVMPCKHCLVEAMVFSMMIKSDMVARRRRYDLCMQLARNSHLLLVL